MIIETKGDYLANAETADKPWLGNKWAALAGDNYKYCTVFQSKEVDGAITLKTILEYLDHL